MRKSATDVMQEAMVAAIIDAVIALKDSAKGVPNTLLREINAIHANTTFADLPPALQAAILASVRAGFHRLLKEGYSVAPAASEPPMARPIPGRQGAADGRHVRREVKRGPGTGHRRDGPKRPRPGGKPGPRKS